MGKWLRLSVAEVTLLTDCRDLTEWAKHGVLLLNTSLTVRASEVCAKERGGDSTRISALSPVHSLWEGVQSCATGNGATRREATLPPAPLPTLTQLACQPCGQLAYRRPQRAAMKRKVHSKTVSSSAHLTGR